MTQCKIIDLYIKEFTTDLLPPTIKTMYDHDQGGVKIAVIGKPGTGKCLAPGTMVVMYDGSLRAVETLKEGELLMGDDSTPRKILSTTFGEDFMYTIEQKNGTNYKVNGPHILSLKNRDKVDVIDISVYDYINTSQEFKNNYLGYKVPIKFKTRSIDVEPYYVACYMSGNKNINVDLKFYKYVYNNIDTEWTIPDLYRVNSPDVLLAFLAGVIDSIGTYCPNKEIASISHEKDRFILDLYFIVSSLGFNNISLKNDTLSFSPTLTIPTTRYSIQPQEQNLFSEISITYSGRGKYYGFTLDGNSRFILHDFTVTHNTTLIKRLIYEKKHIFPVGFLMSGTEEETGAFGKIFPETFKFNKYVEDNISSFIKRQKLARKYCKIPWCVAIIDDCTDDPKVFRKPLVQGVYKNGRNWKLWWILSLQYAVDILPVIITSIDATFIGRESGVDNRQKIYKKYAGVIPSFELFCQLMDKYTDDFCWLVVRNNYPSNKLEDCVFYWKPTPCPEFEFGCIDYKEFHEERYNPKVEQI